MRPMYVSADMVDLYRLQCFLPHYSQRYATLASAISRCDQRPSSWSEPQGRVDGEMMLSTSGGTP
jgi:hypothetical protein